VILQTLGKLELHGGVCSRPKSLLLLSYLAVEGPQERPHLARLFFRGAVDPLGNLRTTLHRLGREIPGAVQVDSTRLRTTLTCDAQQLLSRLDAGDLSGGAALYSGAFLSGIYLPDWSEPLEDWVYARRVSIARRVRSAFLALGEQAAADGNFHAGADLAERACWLAGAPTPTAEELKRLLLLLTAGQSVMLGQLRSDLVPEAPWSVAEAQRTLSASLPVQPRTTAPPQLRTAKPLEAGDLVLGITGFLNHAVVPAALRRYTERYPQARLTFRELFSSAQLEALTDGTLDVGFVTLPIEGDQIAWEQLWREAYVALLPASHPLARQREVPLMALDGEVLVMHPRPVHPPLYDHVLKLLKHNGVVPPQLLEGAGPQTRNQFVAGGFGYTLALPSWPAELPGLARRPIRYAAHQQPMVMDGAVAWHRTRVSAPAAAFIDIVLALRAQGTGRG